MSTATLANASVLDRPVPLRLRSDLRIAPQAHREGVRWVLKDPLTLEYFHLEDREYQLLTLLDGRRSMAEIKRLYEGRFPSDRLSPNRFHALCLALQRDGLLVGRPEDPQRLIEQRREHRQAQWLERLTNVLAIRFRGIDPQPLLDLLYPLTRWLFSPVSVALGVAASLSVFAFVLFRFDLFREQLPEIRSLFTGYNLLLLMLAVLVTKVVHELAHGLTCKHFGGECRELGAMLLVFTPCLYCDVSDAWLIKSRWRRMAVSAAGMYVETLLAATCLVLWWFSREGPLQLFLLNTVMVCTVATVLFNANPLLRFDGYYMLSDWLGVPNLWTRSRAFVEGYLERICLGWDDPIEVETMPSTRRALACYGVASIAYRWLVVVGIVWLMVGFLKPFGLEALAYGAIVLVLATSAFPPLLNMQRKLSDPLKRRRISKLRLGLTISAGLGLLLLLLLIPLPNATRATAVIRLTEASPLYATQAGLLRDSLPYGSQVAAQEVVAWLASADLELQLLETTGRRDQQRVRLATLRTLLGSDPTVAAEIPTASEILRDLDQRVAQLQLQQEELQIKSSRSGTLLAPESPGSNQRSVAAHQAWRSAPLDSENRGQAIAVGDYLGQVGDPGQFHAELFLGTDRIESIGIGQHVELRLRESPGVVLSGRVADISPADRAESNREAGDPPNPHSARSEEYRLRVELETSEQAVTIGARGVAWIHTPRRSLAWRISRSLSRLFALGH